MMKMHERDADNFVALLDGKVVDWLDDEKQDARYR